MMKTACIFDFLFCKFNAVGVMPRPAVYTEYQEIDSWSAYAWRYDGSNLHSSELINDVDIGPLFAAIHPIKWVRFHVWVRRVVH